VVIEGLQGGLKTGKSFQGSQNTQRWTLVNRGVEG
jgi:hypothetical protein